MIEDGDLNHLLRAFAAELAEIATWPDGSLFGPSIEKAVIADEAADALTLARIYTGMSGAQLREKLAQAGALKIDAASPVSEAVTGFFAIWARLAVAFARPLAAEATPPRHIVIAERPKLKPRDTIFERRDGKIGEKTGGQDLAPGQPTSTGDYKPIVPERFNTPPNLEQLTLAQRMTAAGYYTSDDATDADDTRARLGGAPPAAPMEKLRVPFPDDGKMKHATVYVSRPQRLAANAPPVLRADPADAGPDAPSPAPPSGED